MSADRNGRRRGDLWVAAAAVALLAGGGTAIAVGLQQPPPPPGVTAAAPAPGSGPQEATAPPAPESAPTTPAPPAEPVGPVMEAAAPVTLEAAAIGVSTSLMELGLNEDETVEVPPVDSAAPAGWYRGSPTPGALGPSIILGHVNSREGPAVFYRLAELQPGDEIVVTREDGSRAVFQVDRVEAYEKEAFPQFEVYGNTDHAALRLITCGGPIDPETQLYRDNIIAYASLVDAQEP